MTMERSRRSVLEEGPPRPLQRLYAADLLTSADGRGDDGRPACVTAFSAHAPPYARGYGQGHEHSGRGRSRRPHAEEAIRARAVPAAGRVGQGPGVGEIRG